MRAEDIVRYAARLGLSALAITDHDTMAAAARVCAGWRGGGVRVIPGVEVSSFDNESGRRVHLLCYAPKNPAPLLALCEQTLRARHAAGLAMLEKVAARYPVAAEDVLPYAAENGVLYKQHIAAALMHRGFSLSVFGELWNELFSSKAGFARVPMTYPDYHDVMPVMKETGGLVVLAHPGHYRNFEIVPALCELGLDGIEAHHPLHTAEDERRALELAARHGLLVSGGSDFHGAYRARVNPLALRSLAGEELRRFLAALDARGTKGAN